MNVDVVQNLERLPADARDEVAGIDTEGRFPAVFESVIGHRAPGGKLPDREDASGGDAAGADAMAPSEGRHEVAEAEGTGRRDGQRASRSDGDERARVANAESANAESANAESANAEAANAEVADADQPVESAAASPGAPSIAMDAGRTSSHAEAETEAAAGRLSEIEGGGRDGGAATGAPDGGAAGAAVAAGDLGRGLPRVAQSDAAVLTAASDSATPGADAAGGGAVSEAGGRGIETAATDAANAAEAALTGDRAKDGDRSVATSMARSALEPPGRPAANDGPRETAPEPTPSREPSEAAPSAGSTPVDDSASTVESHPEPAAAAASAANISPGEVTLDPGQAAIERTAPAVAAVDGVSGVASPMAGTANETTPTASPGAPAPAPASDAIALQTEWLAARGGGTARLILHPPELGEMAIRVSLRGGAVEVVMVAREAAARVVAEEQSERLVQAFANRDLRLDHFEVRRGTTDSLGMSDDGSFGGSDADGEPATGERAMAHVPSGRGVGPGGEAGSPADLPRIATVSPERGIDLRV